MLRFEGEKEFPRHPPEEVWAKLSDARFLVQCIPGGEVLGEPEADRAVCKVKPALSFVTGSLAEETRWPGFAARASAETGVESMVGFRLFIEGDTLGALNLYSLAVSLARLERYIREQI